MSTKISGSTGVIANIINEKALDLSTLKDAIAISELINWSWGTGANQINALFHDSRSLADGANETLDLYASGALLDPFGDALTLEALKFLYIKNTSDDASLLILGGVTLDIGICSDTSDIIIIKPSGSFLWMDPSAAGLDLTTNKNLKLEHDGTGSSALVYDILAMGLD